MIGRWFSTLFPTRNQRLLKSWRTLVAAINALEDRMRDTTNGEFQQFASRWRKQVEDGIDKDILLVEVFAATREVARRRVGMRHFDVQLLGGIAMHHGHIAEMGTGEGKTLVATLAATLNAMLGGQTHIVTVNDYLAKRDCEWMGEVYRGLGLVVAHIFPAMKPQYRRLAYQADVCYGTNSEFGFDYLRDNMCMRPEDRVQGRLTYAIVDEVDSILIDEARTPLIISGVVEDNMTHYIEMDKIAVRLDVDREDGEGGDFTLDEKHKRAHLNDQGQERVERILQEAGLIQGSLYDPANSMWLHFLDAALRAHFLFQKDVDYVVRDQKVHIVDVFTGRIMAGRRWSSGLHQAIEAKEGVRIEPESQTLASITLQNYFRMYDKLSGMTGTASTEAPEFMQIYGMEVVTVPPHKANIRIDYPDRVYLTLKEKYHAICEEIEYFHRLQRPVLVGTTSIENSELISARLKEVGVRHMVLNAKHHEKESFIIANAGKLAAVTIATNMAGRGTDIVLGGSLEVALADLVDPDEAKVARVKSEWENNHQSVIELGGLHIVGSERHESRRIDNQLRGRSGRQGDPGSTRFYLSLQDNLMRIFASDNVSRLMQKLGLGEGEAIEHNLLSRAIENAQRKVEAHNFEMRKSLLDYDNVVNQQRQFIYEQRDSILTAPDGRTIIQNILISVSEDLTKNYFPENEIPDRKQIEALSADLNENYSQSIESNELLSNSPAGRIEPTQVRKLVLELLQNQWRENVARLGDELSERIVVQVGLQALDRCWREHLAHIDYIKQGIHLRSYAQKQPIQEFKREAFNSFFAMVARYRTEAATFLLRPLNIRIDTSKADAQAEQESKFVPPPTAIRDMNAHHDSAEAATGVAPPWIATPSSQSPVGRPVAPSDVGKRKIGRNDPCYCGSGKKYKRCHGR